MNVTSAEQSKFDIQRIHERITIDKADNGYVVKHWPKMLVVASLKDLLKLIEEIYSKPISKKDDELSLRVGR
jgi:hypothetical protein